MTVEMILSARDKKGIISFGNVRANWYAISRDNTHVIQFYDTDETKFYKTEKSWAKRIVSLMNKGL